MLDGFIDDPRDKILLAPLTWTVLLLKPPTALFPIVEFGLVELGMVDDGFLGITAGAFEEGTIGVEGPGITPGPPTGGTELIPIIISFNLCTR